jgi:hypothetical protein
MKPNMSSVDKIPSNSQPTEVIDFSTLAVNVPQKSSKLTKKHLLIAVVIFLAVGLVVACVLVAIRLVTDSQKEIVKYSMTYKDSNEKSINQTVSVADNSVIYHVVQDGVDAWIVQDFNKNIQVIKAKTGQGSVVCFVAPLNRTMAATPDSVPSAAPLTNQTTKSQTVKYVVLMDPINDITFLGTRASDMCYNIPTYWQVKDCNADSSLVSNARVKRRLRISISISFGSDGFSVGIEIEF